MTRILSGVAVLAFAFVAALPPAFAEKRVALVIGNDSYQSIPALQKAANDARKMGDTLKSLGFSVQYGTNLSRRAMSEALLAFDRAVDAGDTALFFFAGHGFEIQGENYLLPVDVPAATDGQEELVRDAAFAAQRITDRLQARGVRTAILVLDACRNNPFERRGTRAVRGTGGLAAMTPSEGVFIVFSAGAKQTALDRLGDDDANPNSVFTRAFAEQLATPGLTLVQVAKRTQSGVKQMAARVRHDQTPAYYDQVVGDVVLSGKLGDAKVEPLPQIAALPVAPLGRAERRESSTEPVNGPIANFMRHNSGWSVTLSFADPVTAISWRLGESGNFKETGFLDTLDPRTRKRMPNPSLQLDADTPATTIYVRYADLRGDWAQPFPIRFEPGAALARGQRQTLEMSSGSWLQFREFNGLLVYYTHLVSYRCAIREARIGIDTTVPDKKLTLPPCDAKDPAAIPRDVQPYLKLPPATKTVSVELTYTDGSISETKTYRR
ncbi:MAG: caspase family protein [Rhizobiales bacterium]|nr:caspase family protein [Hyphomicrobiales bacterium]